MVMKNLNDNFLVLNFKGLSWSIFWSLLDLKDLKLVLKGDANDYVGKGLSGATISIRLPEESNLVSNENTIIRKYSSIRSNIWKTFCSWSSWRKILL